MSKDLVNKINNALGGGLDYMPYDISKVTVAIGAPVNVVKGLDYVVAAHFNNQTSMVMSLTSKGVFIGNKNMSGFIEFGILGESISGGMIQLTELTGIPFPIFITDVTTGGTSFVIGSACRQVATPEWRRELSPNTNIYTFSTPRLVISNGVRLPNN